MTDSLKEVSKLTFANLIKASVFYLPESVFDLLKITKTESVLKDINTIFLFDKNGKLIRNYTESFGQFVLPKKSYLEENIFLLFEFKEQSSKGGFEYVIEKYNELVLSLLYMSELFCNEIEKDIADLTDDQKTAFTLQHNFYIQHKEIFEAKFKIPPRVYNFNKQTTQTVLKKIKPLAVNLDTQEVESRKPDKKLEKKNQLEKLKNDTRTNAESFLLKIVFKVNID
ncbi:hypothetical protein [Corallibacter sp.]|uniref:hypothetical protein n=1 Tax=Corallibacter sp. TaxID=2038084 RepID=UPI003AB5013E